MPFPLRPASGVQRRIHSTGRLLGALMLALVIIAALPTRALADFSDRVDYTLTTQDGVDFSDQDLVGTSFAGVQARGARFRNADLRGAIFTQASFVEADFRNADLSDVLMDRVDFHDADFRGALLRGVIASGSSFAGATVTDADFSDALLDRQDRLSLCREASGTHPVTGVRTRLSLDCG